MVNQYECWDAASDAAAYEIWKEEFKAALIRNHSISIALGELVNTPLGRAAIESGQLNTKHQETKND